MTPRLYQASLRLTNHAGESAAGLGHGPAALAGDVVRTDTSLARNGQRSPRWTLRVPIVQVHLHQGVIPSARLDQQHRPQPSCSCAVLRARCQIGRFIGVFRQLIRFVLSRQARGARSVADSYHALTMQTKPGTMGGRHDKVRPVGGRVALEQRQPGTAPRNNLASRGLRAITECVVRLPDRCRRGESWPLAPPRPGHSSRTARVALPARRPTAVRQ